MELIRNFDYKILFYLNNLSGQSRFFDLTIIFCGKYLPFIVVLIFLFYLYKAKYHALHAFLAAFIASFGGATLFHFLYHRPRPFLALDIPHLLTETSYSFPSGHASFFFAFSFVIYFYNKKAGTIFLILSALISIARVIAGVHYPSDILGGALLGLAVAYLVSKLIHKKLSPTNSKFLN